SLPPVHLGYSLFIGAGFHLVIRPGLAIPHFKLGHFSLLCGVCRDNPRGVMVMVSLRLSRDGPHGPFRPVAIRPSSGGLGAVAGATAWWAVVVGVLSRIAGVEMIDVRAVDEGRFYALVVDAGSIYAVPVGVVPTA